MRRTKKVAYHLFILFITVLAISTNLFAWQGKVVGACDGDTITVLHDGKGEKLRLYGVDCPESHQDFGQKTKKFTSSMAYGKIADVEPVTTDRYGRTVALVKVEGKSLNEELLKAGLAWVYTKYCNKPFCSQWKKLEDQARQNKTGLWTMPNPIPPWEFRRGNRKK